MAIEIVTIPDLGGAESVEVIELCASVGDSVEQEDSLVVLESDKASMDVPSPVDGSVVKYLVAEGAKMSTEQIEFKQEAVTFSLPKSLRK